MFEVIDNNIKTLFQKEVTFILRNRQYKKGRLINYRPSGCYISFTINSAKKIETFEIPFPFTVSSKPGHITFDYTLEALAERDFGLGINLKSTSPIKKCKFYNAVLVIAH